MLVYGRPLKITTKSALKKAKYIINAGGGWRSGSRDNIFYVDDFMNNINNLCVGKTKFVGDVRKSVDKIAKIYFTDITDVYTFGFMFNEKINKIIKYEVPGGKEFSTKILDYKPNSKWFIETNDDLMWSDSYLEASQWAISRNVPLYQSIY